MDIDNQPIDFIPDDVVSNRRDKAQKNNLLKVSVSLFVLVLIATGAIAFYHISLKKTVKGLESQISDELAEIEKMKSVAESGYKLGVRLSSLEKLINSRIVYSKLMTEISERTPPSVTLGAINLSPAGELVLSGIATSADYDPVSDLKERLLKDTDIFTKVDIVSASGTGESITFTLNVAIDMSKLTESVVNNAGDTKKTEDIDATPNNIDTNDPTGIGSNLEGQYNVSE